MLFHARNRFVLQALKADISAISDIASTLTRTTYRTVDCVGGNDTLKDIIRNKAARCEGMAIGYAYARALAAYDEIQERGYYE